MGGKGSTRWGGHQPRRTVEDCINISIGRMVAQADLARGIQSGLGLESSGHQKWLNDGVEYARLKHKLVWGEQLHIAIDFEAAGQKGKQLIPITHTPTASGGARFWFTCPSCQRRARVLYLPNNEQVFACRACHNLGYEVQQLPKSAR